jgi:hypothetical protein
MFNKKEKVEFYSTNINSLIGYPIEKASPKNFSWYNNLKEQFKNSTNYQTPLRCPGIFTPFQHGFVLRTWYDFSVIPVGNSLEIQYPSSDIFLHTSESIDFHDPRMLMDSFGNNPIEGRKCHKQIIKINTSWFVKLPNDYQLLQTNMPFSEEDRFSAVTGIFDPLINNKITVPLFWHYFDNKPTIIKAGTPLCLLLPIKMSDHDIEIRQATSKEYEWAIFNYRRNNTFVRNYEKIKEISRKFFNNDY